MLLFDRRGEGASDGDPNAWAGGGDRDVKAAIAWLRRRTGAGVNLAMASAIKTAAVSVFANEAPSGLRKLAGRITELVLLIAAPNSPNGEELNRGYHAALRGQKTL